MTNTKKYTVGDLVAVYYDNAMNEFTLEFENNVLLDVSAKVFEGQEFTDDFFGEEENFKKALEEGEFR